MSATPPSFSSFTRCAIANPHPPSFPYPLSCSQLGHLLSDLRKDLETLRGALYDVQGSTRFPRWLEIFLRYGNYMNGGTNRGGAMGFKLSSLEKIYSTRSTSADAKITLIRYGGGGGVSAGKCGFSLSLRVSLR